MNGTGIGEVRTKLLDTDHKQWNTGMGIFDPNRVFYKADPNGYVIIDGKRCKIVEKPDRSNPNVAVLNGQVFDNTFYKNETDNIICSKLVDEISLPAGYNKCYYVYNNDPTTDRDTMISTGIKLPKNFGHIYFSCHNKSVMADYSTLWRNNILTGQNEVTRFTTDQQRIDRMFIYLDTTTDNGNPTLVVESNNIFGLEITSDRKWKRLLGTSYSTLIAAHEGIDNTDNTLYFFAKSLVSNLYYMFVVDDNKNLTHCFIPCQNAATGQFGLYEVVTNQFFGNDALTGE